MRPEVEREWDFGREPREEYVVKIVVPPGVHNERVEDAIRAAAQYVHDVALRERVECRVVAGRADMEASYVPSLSMYGHEKLAELDNRRSIPADDTIYV